MDESRREFWQNVCAEYERGAATLSEVAERHGVARSTLSHWRWRLKREGHRVRPRSEVAASRRGSEAPVRAIQVVAATSGGAAQGPVPSEEPYVDARVGDVELRFVGHGPQHVVAVLSGLTRC